MSEAATPDEARTEDELCVAYMQATRVGDADELDLLTDELRARFGYRNLHFVKLTQRADRRRYRREPCPLTERELAVLEMAARGLDNTEIGKRLHLARSTVKTYLDRCYVKLGVRDRTGAAVRALSHGWISQDQYLGDGGRE